MANNLTWRDVAPPDFSGVLNGYRIAGDNITNAARTFSDALGAFDTSRKNDVANAIYQASMQYADPAALKAAMADGSLYAKAGVNPALITVDTNKALDNRASTLLSQAAAQTMLDHTKVMNPLQEQQQRTQNAFDIANNPLRLGQAQATLDQTKQNTSQSKTRFDNEQSQLQQSSDATKFAEQAARGSNNYNDALAALVANKDPALDENTRAAALKLLPGIVKQYNPDTIDLPVPGSGGAGQQSNGRVGSVAPISNPNVGSGAMYSPSSAAALIRKVGGTEEEARTLGAIAMAESSGNPRAHNPNANTGDNSYGLWQINMLGKMGPERLAKYGLKSNEDLFDPLTNARVALQMSREAKGFKDWTTYTSGKHTKYLGNANSGAVDPNRADNPNIQEANAEQNSRASSLIQDAATRINQRNSDGIQGQYAKTQANTEMTLDQAVKQLKESGFKDVSDRTLRDRLKELVTQSSVKGKPTITYATAAAMFNNTSAPDDRGWLNPLRIFDPYSKDGVISDNFLMPAQLKEIASGKSENTERVNTAQTAIATAVQAAMDTKNKAYNELMQAQENARIRPDVRGTLPEKLNRYNRASQALEQLLQKHAAKSRDDAMAPQFKN